MPGRAQMMFDEEGSFKHTRDAVIEGEPYPVKGWMTYKTNPMQTGANRSKTMEMIHELDFMMTVDIAMSDTAWMADLVLAGTQLSGTGGPGVRVSGLVGLFRGDHPRPGGANRCSNPSRFSGSSRNWPNGSIWASILTLPSRIFARRSWKNCPMWPRPSKGRRLQHHRPQPRDP